jgi:hypothetical protein
MFKSNGSFLRPAHRLEHSLLEKGSASNLALARPRTKGLEIQRHVNEGPVKKTG